MIMNIKQQISKFRSDILIGKYPTAINQAKNILNTLTLLQSLGVGNYQSIRDQIQLEYEKCLAINNTVRWQGVQEKESVKKWGGKNSEKERTGKWARKQQRSSSLHQGMLSPIGHKEHPMLKEELQPDLSLFMQSTKESKEEERHEFIDKLEKQVLLPLRMPAFFSNKPAKLQLIRTTKMLYNQIVDYFVQNGFHRISFGMLEFSVTGKQEFMSEVKDKELVVECRQDQLESIQSVGHTLRQIHCIFIIPSDRNTLEQF